jgi:hypothetical protein
MLYRASGMSSLRTQRRCTDRRPTKSGKACGSLGCRWTCLSACGRAMSASGLSMSAIHRVPFITVINATVGSPLFPRSAFCHCVHRDLPCAQISMCAAPVAAIVCHFRRCSNANHSALTFILCLTVASPVPPVFEPSEDGDGSSVLVIGGGCSLSVRGLLQHANANGGGRHCNRYVMVFDVKARPCMLI